MKEIQIVASTPMTGSSLNPSLNVKLHQARSALTRHGATEDSELLSELIERIRSESRQLPLRFRIQQSLNA